MTIQAEFIAKIIFDFDGDIENMETVSGQEQILRDFMKSYCEQVKKVKDLTQIRKFEIDLDSLKLCGKFDKIAEQILSTPVSSGTALFEEE